MRLHIARATPFATARQALALHKLGATHAGSNTHSYACTCHGLSPFADIRECRYFTLRSLRVGKGDANLKQCAAALHRGYPGLAARVVAARAPAAGVVRGVRGAVLRVARVLVQARA